MDAAPHPGPTVVTLIHGTFARGAPWTQEESALRRELAHRLGPVIFRTFDWSGANSHNGRIAAGTLLGKHIRDLKSEFPEANHVLIAHSHGGNVILYAFRDLEVRNAISGFVTLGTPFIECTVRPEHTVVGIVRYLAAASTFILSLLLLVAWYPVPPAQSITSAENWILVAIATLFAIAAWKMIQRPARRWFLRAGNRASSRLNPPAVQVPCLVVHTARDEAGLLLTTARRLATAPFQLSTQLLGVLPTMIITTALLLGLGELLGPLMALGSDPSTDYKFIMAISAAGVLLFLVAIPIGMTTFPALIRGHPLAFGWERIIDNLTVDIATQVLPRKEQHKLDHVLKFSGGRVLGGLRHSGMYHDPTVIKNIAQWVSDLTSARADDSHIAKHTMGGPVATLTRISWGQLAFRGAIVFILCGSWASGLLDAAYSTYADPTWRTQLPRSAEQLVHSEQLGEVHSTVSGVNSWVYPFKVPDKGKCRVSGTYVGDPYALNLNVETNFSIEKFLSKESNTLNFELQSAGLTSKDGRKRRSFDLGVSPGEHRLRLWILLLSGSEQSAFHLTARLNCWSGDVAYVSQTWLQQVRSLDLSPLGLPYPFWPK